MTDPAMTNALWVLSGLLVCAGFAGLILPALPGSALIFAGLLLAAWVDGFARVGWATLTLIFCIGVLSYVVDFIAASLGAKRAGASPRAMVGAALGTVVGMFLGPIGLLLGPLAGAVLGEWTKHRDWKNAGRVGAAAWIGFILGSAVKIALAFSMVAIFLAAMFVF